MFTFANLSSEIQAQVNQIIKDKFGPYAEVNDREEIQIMYPYAYQPIHGYVAINRTEVLVCDSTPDHGDEIVAGVFF